MQEVKCGECLQVQRVEYDTAHVASSVPLFCSYCGSSNVQSVKIDSYWYEIAEGLGFERSARGAEFVQGLYRIWDIKNYRKFRDFVEAMIKENE